MSMRLLVRRRLGVLLVPTAFVASLTLGGCGDDSGDAAEDPAPTSGSPSAGGTPSDGAVDFTEVALLSASAVGGTSARKTVVLDTEQARAEFARQFTDERMPRAIERAVRTADVPEDRTLLGAVVSVGCHVPEEVSVVDTGHGLQITAAKQAPSRVECLVPVTTVALVAVESALV